MIEIPRFTLEETEVLVTLLEKAGIPHELKGVSIGASRYRGMINYLICVEEEWLPKTIAVLKEYYELADGPVERFTGICPACQADVTDAAECPSCGLAFIVDQYELLADHPFCIFLKKLENRTEEAPKGFY